MSKDMEKKPIVVDSERKKLLLDSARAARIQWILRGKQDRFVSNGLFTSLSKTTLPTSNPEKDQKSSLIEQTPGAKSIAEIIDFLDNFVNDGQHYQFESMLYAIKTIQDSKHSTYTEESSDPSPQTSSAHKSLESLTYNDFIDCLLSSEAMNLIKNLQQFIMKLIQFINKQILLKQQFITTNNNTNPTNSSNGSKLSHNNQFKQLKTKASDDFYQSLNQQIYEFLDYFVESILEPSNQSFQLRLCAQFPTLFPSDMTLREKLSSNSIKHLRELIEQFVFVHLFPLLYSFEPNIDVIGYNQPVITFQSYHLRLSHKNNLQDQELFQRIHSLSFITADHLDIKLFHQIPIPLFQYVLTYYHLQDQFTNPQMLLSDDGKIRIIQEIMKQICFDLQLEVPLTQETSSFAQIQWPFSYNIHDPINILLLKPILLLSQLTNFYTIHDKLICLRQICLSIVSLLTKTREYLSFHASGHRYHADKQKETAIDWSNSSLASLPGSDELLPMIILTIKYCNPIDLMSQLSYIQHYLEPRLMVSEAGYLLTNFLSAMHFLTTINKDSLTIQPDAFQQFLVSSKQGNKEQQSKLEYQQKKQQLNSQMMQSHHKAWYQIKPIQKKFLPPNFFDILSHFKHPEIKQMARLRFEQELTQEKAMEDNNNNHHMANNRHNSMNLMDKFLYYQEEIEEQLELNQIQQQLEEIDQQVAQEMNSLQHSTLISQNIANNKNNLFEIYQKLSKNK